MWVRTAVWPRFIKRRLSPPLARSWLTFPLSNHNPLCFIVHLKAVCGQRCSGAAVVIGETSFPVTVQASEFVFAKCPCRWEDGGRWEELCVLFTDGSDRNPNPNRGEREGGDRSGVLRVVGWGVTVWRGKVCWSVIGTTHIHTHTLSSYMLYIHTYRGRVILGGLCSTCTVCPCALSTPTVWRDGGQSQMFPLERLHCVELQKRHPAWQKERVSRKKQSISQFSGMPTML